MTRMTTPVTTLSLKSLELAVCIGWLAPEQQQKQTLLADIDLIFSEPPAACISDHLEDTVCYAMLVEKIREMVGNKIYYLIEHLTYDIYQLLKQQLPPSTQISVCVTKHPNVPGLNGGACFRYGDTSSW